MAKKLAASFRCQKASSSLFSFALFSYTTQKVSATNLLMENCYSEASKGQITAFFMSQSFAIATIYESHIPKQLALLFIKAFEPARAVVNLITNASDILDLCTLWNRIVGSEGLAECQADGEFCLRIKCLNLVCMIGPDCRMKQKVP